jgi:hypothetical protein
MNDQTINNDRGNNDMEHIKIEKDSDLVDVLKCKTDEILFVRYDSAKDPDATSALIEDILSACQDYDIPCLCMPNSDEDVYVELEQWDVDRLRNLDNKLQEIIRKKSPIILT